MALTAAFSIEQNDDKTKIIITDISNYSGADVKANFSARNLIIYKEDGTIFRPTGATSDTIDFNYTDYPDDEIEVEGLDKDYAFEIIMELTPVSSQSGSIYTATVDTAVVGYTMAAFLDRMARQAAQPRLEHNQAYQTDTHKILMEKELAVKAAANGDLTSAQLALNRANKIITNPIPY